MRDGSFAEASLRMDSLLPQTITVLPSLTNCPAKPKPMLAKMAARKDPSKKKDKDGSDSDVSELFDVL